ncbi:MAG: TonB-dependent receptor [Paraglaciecola sp.]|uniref:TonB-dependent receptor domain-containing protein n=1 Tax=Paraglaciecola sp. TaxID=1920173 RepID=UPI003279CC86
MRSHRLFSKSILSIAISQAALSGFAIAEESTTLDELKIEGRAITELDQEITSEDIEKSQANSLEDLFRDKSEITSGGTNKVGQKIYVRNIGEDSLNITIDGAEQAAGVFHHAGRITIEPELLQRVEIEAGAANATSGPGALGGSVRFITKDASDLLRDDQNIGALLKSTYSSNGEGLKNSAAIYGRTKSGKTEGMIHISDSSHDDYVDGNGDELTGTELDETLGFAKFKTQLTNEQSLSLSYEALEASGNITYKPEWAYHATENALSESDSIRKTTTLNYQYVDTDSDLIDTLVTLYQTKNNLDSIHVTWGPSTGYVETYGATIQNTSIISKHELTYGLNYREDLSDYENGDYSEAGTVSGIYIQDTLEATDKLTLSAGVRYDQYDLTDVNDNELSDSGVSPNLGIKYQLNNELDFTANYAKALRGPEVKDAYKISAGVSNDAELKAETSTNLEIGFNYHKDRWFVGAGVYHSTIDDVIGTELPWSKVYLNLEDSIESTGFYLDASYSISNLTAGLHFHTAETKAGDDIVTRYVYGSTANSIGDTLALSLDYEFSNTFQAGWSAEMVKGMYDLEIDVNGSSLEFDKPGYAVHNIYAKWLPLDDDQLTVVLTINNLFDKQYLSHAVTADYTAYPYYDAVIGQASSGRDIRLSAAYKF